LIEVMMQKVILVAHGCCMTPHDVPQADGRSHVRGEVQAGIVSRTVDDRHHRIDLLEE
jgi:hypothetical protein